VGSAPIYPGKNILIISYWWITHWVLAWSYWGCWFYLIKKAYEGTRERILNGRYQMSIWEHSPTIGSDMFMNAKYGSVLLFLAGRTLYCTHRNMLNPAQENDSVLIRMSSVFVRTTASRSLCLWMPATLFVTHVGTQFYSDRQMWQYKCANQSNELVEYTYEMHAT
jgi:hypothetical protein